MLKPMKSQRSPTKLKRFPAPFHFCISKNTQGEVSQLCHYMGRSPNSTFLCRGRPPNSHIIGGGLHVLFVFIHYKGRPHSCWVGDASQSMTEYDRCVANFCDLYKDAAPRSLGFATASPTSRLVGFCYTCASGGCDFRSPKNSASFPRVWGGGTCTCLQNGTGLSSRQKY